jgi:bifunctional DNA-binding transcriptional regulator/antitoxin component of YhaV-PrlF toxin-antitoxin module
MIAQIEYDEFHDEYYLVLPDNMMEQLGWDVGDTLVWTLHEDGKVGIRKYTELQGN